MRVYSPLPARTKEHQAALIPDLEPILGTIRPHSANQRAIYWDIEDAVRSVPALRSDVATVGKNLIGPGFRFVKVEGYEDEATDEALETLKRFYGIGVKKTYKNIKDYYETSSKFYATAVKLAMGNACAWEVRRDVLFRDPISFDCIPGYVEPQYDSTGTLASPAFRQYLSISGLSYVTWDDPNDIVFFCRPDFGGLAFSSDLEALTRFTLPADIYAALSWLAMHKNRNAPLDGIWVADPGMSDDDYDELQKFLMGRYGGASNYAKSPILSRGGVDFKRISRAQDELPYKEGRDWARQEMAGVTGVPGSKVGITSEMSRANSREAKRDYHETTMEPLQLMISEVTYQQVHIRLFDIRGWKIQFGNPMFVNEIEQASIDRTYYNIGAVNANELRERDGKDPYNGGEQYFIPSNIMPVNGRPANEIPNQEEKPAKEGPDTSQTTRPVRADEQMATPEAIKAELLRWRKFALARSEKGKPSRIFESQIIPLEFYLKIFESLGEAEGDPELIKLVFKLALEKQDE